MEENKCICGELPNKQDTVTLVLEEGEFEFTLRHWEGIYTMIKADKAILV